MVDMDDELWAKYEHDGYVHLGRILDDGALAKLQERIDDIMLGRADIDYDRLLMQLDSDSGKYEDAGAQTPGFKGPTRDYRKIQGLELDSRFLAYLGRPIFRDVCARVYGGDKAIRCYRAMFMNKPAARGTLLPWHQDRWVHLDRDPLFTIWTALDPATKENGCVQIIPGSHRRGVINPAHPWGFLTPEQAIRHCPEGEAVHLELRPGEAVLLHNWLLHRSDKNHSGLSRRAFSVCYMDADTRVMDDTLKDAGHGQAQHAMIF